MSCDNIIDTGKCYIQGDTYNPYVMSISSLGVPLNIPNGWYAMLFDFLGAYRKPPNNYLDISYPLYYI